MGLSIHYSGRIADKSKLHQLIEELEEIAHIHEWDCHVFEREFPQGDYSEDEHDDNLYGILFSPPKCEPVSITFLSNERMCGPMQLMHWGNSSDEKEQRYLYLISTKTQYAGVEIHKMVIGIFRYLHKQYLTDFELIDEGEYWETNDEELLKRNFKKSTDLINSVASALKNNQRNIGENIEAYIERVIQQMHDKNRAKS
jgi:hypothetical protein